MKVSSIAALASLFATAMATPMEERAALEALDVRSSGAGGHEARDGHVEPNARDLAGRSAAAAPVDLKKRDFQGIANPTYGTLLRCREHPNLQSDYWATYTAGTKFMIKCQTTGKTIKGNNIWNRVNRPFRFDCWVPDYYTKTGYTWIPGVPRC